MTVSLSEFHRAQPHQPTNNPNASKMAQKVGGADGCPRCGQAVYAAEKVVGAGKVRNCLSGLLTLEIPLTGCYFSVV